MFIGVGLTVAAIQQPRSAPTALPRASSLAGVTNANTVTYTLPTGSQAGDMCVVFVAHSYAVTCPSGWVPLSDVQTNNYCGMTIHKVLTSADISTGTIAINFANTNYGTVVGVTMAGALGIVSAVSSANNTGSATRSLSTDAAPTAGNPLLLFGSERASATASTTSLPTAIASNVQTNSSSVAVSGTVSAPGAQSATLNYSGSPSGDYQAFVALTAVAVSTRYTNAGGTGNRSASITVTATNIAAGGGAPGDTVDGSFTGSYWWTNATGDGSGYLRFDFGAGVSKVIDQFRVYQDNTTLSHGIWRFEGSNDASAWTQCGVDFTLVGNAAIPVPNRTGYRYYRLRHMSGARTQTPFIEEIEFKIA